MTSHLRHCPKHKKALRCPHCALAAKPAQVAAAVAVADPEPASVSEPSKKRGRPPKNTVAMTPKERMAKMRSRNKMKEHDVERRNLVAEILTIVRREQSGPGATDRNQEKELTPEREVKIRGENRKHLHIVHDALMTSSIEDLKTVLESKKATPDTHGRLHNERSGEAGRKYGQTEIERILAARQYSGTNVVPFWMSPATMVDESLDPTLEQSKQMAAGFRVRPEGHGPDKSVAKDERRDADPADNRPGRTKPVFELTAEERWVRKTIWIIVHNMKFEPSSQCPFCSDTFLTQTGMEFHLEQEYYAGKLYVDKQWKIIDAVQEFNAKYEGLAPGGTPPVTGIDMMNKGYQHYRLLGQEIDNIRREARKKAA